MELQELKDLKEELLLSIASPASFKLDDAIEIRSSSTKDIMSQIAYIDMLIEELEGVDNSGVSFFKAKGYE